MARAAGICTLPPWLYVCLNDYNQYSFQGVIDIDSIGRLMNAFT